MSDRITIMSRWIRGAKPVIAVLVMTAGLEAVSAAVVPATSLADVCASVGRRVSVGGCTNIADAVSPWVAPPAAYAPLPEDFVAAPPPPPPPPMPNVNVCAGIGRRIRVSGCV
jgi:hypothetical protein